MTCDSPYKGHGLLVYGGEKIARTVIAFANGAGGRIVFGVRNEPRKIIGLSDNALFQLEERVGNHIFDKCAPAIVPEFYIQNVEDKALLVVEIYPGPQKPYHLKTAGRMEGTYVRIGSVTRKASHDIIASLERARRKVSFDEEPQYEVAWEQLDLHGFTETYFKASGRRLDDPARLNLGLVTEDRDGRHPTTAAVLLSGGPLKRRIFPYAKIECARFKGTDTKVFIDQATFDGPVHGSIDPCIAFIKRNIALGSQIGEVYREDRWEYPLEAIREAVTNAVIHRDYAIAGSDIKIAIFDDMLEITSPGALPDNLSPDALGTGRSEIRNRVLAPIFKDLGLIEAWGTGIRRMRTEMETYTAVDLILQEVGQAFQVQFVKSTTQGGQESRNRSSREAPEVTPEVTPEARLLTAMEGEMSRKDIQTRLGLKDEEHFRTAYLLPSIEAGLIEMTVPEKPRSSKQRYRLTEKGKAYLRRAGK